MTEKRIWIRDPKRCVVRIRLSGRELTEARQLAKLLTKGNLSRLMRYALQRLYEEEKENVLRTQ